MPQTVRARMDDPAIRVAAFDVYGTLARWPAGRVQPIAVQRLLSRFGIEISYQAFEAARQIVFFQEAVKRPITGWMDFLALVFGRMGTSVSTDLLSSLVAEYEARNDMELFPDALPALDHARGAGLVTCAFTTLPSFMIGRQRHQILSRLDHYFDGAATGHAKGHPAFYRRIRERLGVAAGEILCVGDDLIGDVELPIEAGWKPVLLDREGRRPSGRWSALPAIRGLDEFAATYSGDSGLNTGS